MKVDHCSGLDLKCPPKVLKAWSPIQQYSEEGLLQGDWVKGSNPLMNSKSNGLQEGGPGGMTLKVCLAPGLFLSLLCGCHKVSSIPLPCASAILFCLATGCG